jgi:hypothetical protein
LRLWELRRAYLEDLAPLMPPLHPIAEGRRNGRSPGRGGGDDEEVEVE